VSPPSRIPMVMISDTAVLPFTLDQKEMITWQEIPMNSPETGR
jgi:hypothetical protein